MKLFVFLQSYLIATVASLKSEERGATMVEYGLMVALIAVVCIAAVTLIGTNLAAKFTTVANAVN
ncbi:MAG TPA: Flp family type IVb pilin [Acidimicrobiales bacterium]|nr:Flp family type IVb pilin [Acidimicrobiales bacterium]